MSAAHSFFSSLSQGVPSQRIVEGEDRHSYYFHFPDIPGVEDAPVRTEVGKTTYHQGKEGDAYAITVGKGTQEQHDASHCECDHCDAEDDHGESLILRLPGLHLGALGRGAADATASPSS